MSTKFTLNRLANAQAVRLRVYSGGHQVHVDLEPFDLEELARETLKLACDIGLNPIGPVAKAPKRKRKQKTDDWKS